MKKLIKKTFVFFLTLTVLTALSCKTGSVESLQERAQKIKQNMTYKEVVHLMGSIGEEKNLNNNNSKLKFYSWTAEKPDEGRTLVTFENNKVSGVSSSENWKPKDFFAKN